MIEARSLADLEAVRSEWKDRTVAFVPTMGFLHEGHLSLVRKARELGDRLVVSIFVNPLQFGPDEDFDAYPRDEERDRALLEEEGVDLVFMPTTDVLYPEGYATHVSVSGGLASGLCGESRPGHFDGVATVVSRLFRLVRPAIAVFGEKDYQQLMIVRRLTEDLRLSVRVIGYPIVREPDGLAMSSRNMYLDSEQRDQALGLHRALEAARHLHDQGAEDRRSIEEEIADTLKRHPGIRPQYLAVVDAETLSPVERLDGRVLVALAGHVSKTRLIDNVVLEPGARGAS